VKAQVPSVRPYYLKTYFNKIQPDSSSNKTKRANNAPEYKYSWTSAPVEVKRWSNCADVLKADRKARSGTYKISVRGVWKPFHVYCDMRTHGGGWTVIQRRKDGSVNFTRNWKQYAEGFWVVKGEHWLGNDRIAALTADKPSRLRIDLDDGAENHRYAEYGLFKIHGDRDKYRLVTAKYYKGTAGDSLSPNRGAKFATHDRDTPGRHARINKGGWWHVATASSFLNGVYKQNPKETYPENSLGIIWSEWMGKYYSLKFTEMKIRPASF